MATASKFNKLLETSNKGGGDRVALGMAVGNARRDGKPISEIAARLHKGGVKSTQISPYTNPDLIEALEALENKG